MKRLVIVLWVFAAVAGRAVNAQAQAADISGRLGSNSTYHIEVPAEWNGTLVIWNHGFSLAPPQTVPDLGPLQVAQLAEGYAIAASSYRQAGWATFGIQQDMKNLYEVFRRNFGVPREVIVTGASFGGLATIQAIEEANVGNVVGGLSLSGALAGSRNWDGALDARLVYDLACGEVPGAAIPGGAAGLPKNSTFTTAQLGAALFACFGLPGTPAPEQLARLGLFLGTIQIPPSFIGTVMGFATFGLADLTWDPLKLSGQLGTGNVNVDYGNPVVNSLVTRAAPNVGAATKLRANYTPTGDTRGARIVSMHTDKDGLVLVENEKSYADVAPASAFTAAVVVEAVPTHVGFTAAEVLASWESLRGWLAGGPQPTPATIQAMCGGIVLGGLAAGPCRIDPGFVIPDISGRVRPR